MASLSSDLLSLFECTNIAYSEKERTNKQTKKKKSKKDNTHTFNNFFLGGGGGGGLITINIASANNSVPYLRSIARPVEFYSLGPFLTWSTKD